MRVLAVNPGSSSLKLAVVEDGEAVETRSVEPSDEPAAHLRDLAASADAAGIRVVHGGTEVTAHARIDDAVLAALDRAAPLAPLHNPPALAAIRALREQSPRLPLVACLDTAFHAQMPEAARVYALPREWRERWDLRRVGFHGLSHSWASHRAARLCGRPAGELRTVTCHLGAGASLAAVRHGVSVDTTMGYTPVEGLVMATRSGSVDPGLLLHVMSEAGLDAAAASEALDRRSGLLGLSGHAAMEEVERAAAGGDAAAALALEVHGHRLRAAIAAMAAAMGGVDAVAFTGGIGENSAATRARAAQQMAFLGITVDEARNGAGEPDRVISSEGSAVTVSVVRCREELEMARIVGRVLEPDRSV